MKYTAEKVRAIAKRLHDDITVKDGDTLTASDMLTAYADLLEQIKADEGVVPDSMIVLLNHLEGLMDSGVLPEDAIPAKMWNAVSMHNQAHPPAQAAQGDLRNSLLRGKAQNEEPRIRHSCNMGVGCEETGICYAEANGQPEQCGRPTAEPVAQGEASLGRCKACGRATRAVCDGLDGNGLGCTNAPPIDIAAVRKVIAHLRQFNSPYTRGLADKLEAALQEKGNG